MNLKENGIPPNKNEDSKGQAVHGMNWMYQGTGAQDEQRKAEEESYLLGKEFNPNNVKTGDLAVGNESVGISRVVESIAATANRIDNLSERNENFHLRHEDPMFMVNQTRREKERERKKKKELFEKTAAAVFTEDKRHHRKRSSKKSSSSRHRGRSSSVSSNEDNKRKHRKKKDKKRRKRHRRSRSNSNSSRSSNDSGTSGNEIDYRENRQRHHRRRRKHSRRRGHSVSRSRSSSPERSYRRHRKHSRRERSRSYDKNSRRDYDIRSNKNKDYEYEKNVDEHNRGNGDKKEVSAVKGKAYGLINSSTGLSEKSRKNQSLGPDQHLLAKKRQEKEEARNRYKRRGRNHDARMTDEERKAALDAMQQDANNRITHLSKASESQKVDLHDEEIKRRMRDGSKEVSSFVHDMVVKAHGISNGNVPSLAQQVAQNRDKIQKASDDSFL